MPVVSDDVPPFVEGYGYVDSSESLDGLELRPGCRIRHDHSTRQAHASSVERDALRHISRTGRVDSSGQLLWVRDGHRVRGATNLERADGLEAFEFEPDFGAGGSIESNKRCPDRSVGDAVAGRLDGFE